MSARESSPSQSSVSVGEMATPILTAQTICNSLIAIVSARSFRRRVVKNFVANSVPVSIVDVFEAIQIEYESSNITVVAAVPGQCAARRFRQHPPVRQTCQTVMLGQE